MELRDFLQDGATLFGWCSAVAFAYNRAGGFWRWSSRGRAKSHGKQYREMVRRMTPDRMGEIVAYAAQRITAAILGVLLIFIGLFLGPFYPPAMADIINVFSLLVAGALIAYTGEELIRLSDFDSWKERKKAKIAKCLSRAGMKDADLKHELAHLTGEKE